MNTDHTARHVLPFPRCPRCAGRLHRCRGELYCPSCTAFTLPPAPPPPAWYEARTVDGSYVHSGRDPAALVRWVLELLDGSPGDVVVSARDRVVAVVLDTGAVVRVR
jgi:hypothetical protein